MDKQYWEEYYAQKNAPVEPSSFAKNVLKQIQYTQGQQRKKLLDIGCGNGRDSGYFASQGLEVWAIDQSSEAITAIRLCYRECTALHAIQADLIAYLFQTELKFDYIYSRFSLHAINEQEERQALKEIYNCLVDGGQLFIESRSVNDELFGLGEYVERNAYIYNGHYRRFIIMDELVESLKQIGFAVLFAREEKGWAVCGEEDPSVIRILAKK